LAAHLLCREEELGDLLPTVPAFALMVGISAGAVRLIQQLQSWRCPAGTFLYASGQGATARQIIPIFLALIGFGFFAIN